MVSGRTKTRSVKDSQVSVGFTGNESEVDLEALRRRLQKMKDQELKRFELAAQFMCSPGANQGQPPREAFVVQLEAARAEIERRKTAESPCIDKEKYGSAAEAYAVAAYRVCTTRDKPAALRAYKCSDCGGWHLTKQV